MKRTRNHRTLSLILFSFCLLFIPACCKDKTRNNIGFIRVADDNWTFVDSETGKTFIPFGINHCHWSDCERPQIEADFANMKKLGVNIARVNIPSLSGWLKRKKPYEFEIIDERLSDFLFLVEIAEKHNVRLILCQDAWSNPKDLGDAYAADEAIAYQCFAYKHLAGLLKSEPVIFAYTLMNEPRNIWDTPARREKWNTWVREKYVTLDALRQSWPDLKDTETFGKIEIPENKHSPGSQRLYDYQLFGRDIAYNWTKQMADAIKSEDKNHLISLGAVQWSLPFDRLNYPGGFDGFTGFDPKTLADLLDFTCVHYYPFSWHHPTPLDWQTIKDPNIVNDWLYCAEAFHRYSYVGKPVIFEEFNFGLTPRGAEIFDPNVWQMVAEWNEMEIAHTSTCASGWLSWPYRDKTTVDDITNAGGLVDPNDNIKPWGKTFQRLAKTMQSKKLKRAPADKVMTIDEKQILTSDKALKQFWLDYLALRRQGHIIDFELEGELSKKQ